VQEVSRVFLERMLEKIQVADALKCSDQSFGKRSLVLFIVLFILIPSIFLLFLFYFRVLSDVIIGFE
jgi:hypothetical protein